MNSKQQTTEEEYIIIPNPMYDVVERLQRADINNPDLDEQMHAEDEYLEALIKRDNEISWLNEKVEIQAEELEAKTEELEAKTEELETKTEELETKTEELDKEKAASYQLKLELARTLKKLNDSVEEIARKTGLSEDEIDKL